jgi:hypothetical protein
LADLGFPSYRGDVALKEVMAMVKLRNTFHVDQHRWMEAAS